MVSLRVCGPKLSICCSVMSVWGIVMLLLMGIFLRVNSVAFADDLKLDDAIKEGKNAFETAMNRLYSQSSYNCFIAACLYVLSLSFSIWQYYLNRRASVS